MTPRQRTQGTAPRTIAGGGRLTLARKGRPLADIVVAREASEPVKHAGRELARVLRRVTGARFAVRQTPGLAPCHLLVGPAAARLVDSRFSTDGLGCEGIVLRTRGDFLIMAGGEPRGTLYAVYTFLEDTVGCRWWSSKSSHIPRRPTLTAPALKTRYVPPLEYRDVYSLDARDPDWSARNKVNGSPGLSPATHGGPVLLGGVHTFYRLIPPDTYFADHPHWFSLIDGKRTHEKAQLCLSSPGLFRQLVANLKDEIRANPGRRIFSVSPNDWAGNCQCRACRARDRKAGSPAGSLLHFVNAVAEAVEGEFPGVMISTLAYTYTRRAPREIRPRHNVIIELCAFECSFAHPLTHPLNADFRRDIEAWSKLTDRIYVWDYVTNFSHYFLPFPNLDVLAANTRFFAGHSVRGILALGPFNALGTELAELRAWVLAKLLWDPKRNGRRLVAEFCGGYYGAGAPFVLTYLRRLQKVAGALDEPVHCYSGPTRQYLSFGLLSDAWRALEAAADAVAGERVLARRVASLQATVLYAFLGNWNELRMQCRAAGAAWPPPERIETAAATFKRMAKGGGATHAAERHEGFARIDERVAATKKERRSIGP